MYTNQIIESRPSRIVKPCGHEGDEVVLQVYLVVFRFKNGVGRKTKGQSVEITSVIEHGYAFLVKSHDVEQVEANHFFSEDMKEVFEKAVASEKSPLGCQILNQLEENLKIALFYTSQHGVL